MSVNAYTSLASHSCEKSFVFEHEYEAKDVIYRRGGRRGLLETAKPRKKNPKTAKPQ